MRDAQQIRLLPGDYYKLKAQERQRTLGRLLGDLKRARDTDAKWYREALAFASSFNRRPLVHQTARKPLAYGELPEGY